MADPLKMSDRPRGWNAADERRFRTWYAKAAKQFGLDPNPDDPRHHYNYRHAFKKGAWGDAEGHWPSDYKDAAHPNRFVEGKDTISRATPVKPSGFRDMRADERRSVASTMPKFELPDAVARPLRDIGIMGLNAAIGLPEAIVGIADIPTLGRTGKFLEETVGYRPQEAREIIGRGFSPEQQAAQRALDEAQGWRGKFNAAIQNPRLVGQAVLESTPQLLAGGAAMRAVKAAPLLVGAVTEGALAAGSQAEGIRQQSPERTLTPTQAGLATLTGLATGGVTVGGGRVAQRLGVADPDVILSQIGQAAAGRTGRTAGRVVGAAAAEGAEEVAQSVPEQINMNLATGRPAMEGVEQAGVMGGLSGAAMGAGTHAVAPRVKPATLGSVGQVQTPTPDEIYAAHPEFAPADYQPPPPPAPARSTVNEPINAMENIGAASMRMMNEDPSIVQRAEAMRDSGLAAKQAIEDQKKGRGGVSVAIEGPQVVSDEEFIARTAAAQPFAGITEPRFKGWQEALPGEPPMAIYDWPIDDQGRFTTGGVTSLQQAGFAVPATPPPPSTAADWTSIEDLLPDQQDTLQRFGQTPAAQTPTVPAQRGPLQRLVEQEVGTLGDFEESPEGTPLPPRAETGGEEAARTSVIAALTQTGSTPERAQSKFNDFQKQATKAGKPVNVWANDQGQIAALPEGAKGGQSPFPGGRVVATLQPQAGPPVASQALVPQPQGPQMALAPPMAEGLGRLRSRLEREIAPQVKKDIPAGKLAAIVKREGILQEELDYTPFGAWLADKVAAEAKLQDKTITGEAREALKRQAIVTPQELEMIVGQSRLPVSETEYRGNNAKWGATYTLPGPAEDHYEVVMRWPEYQPPPSATPPEKYEVIRQTGPTRTTTTGSRHQLSGPHDLSKLVFRMPDGTRRTYTISDFTRTNTTAAAQERYDETSKELVRAGRAVQVALEAADPALAAKFKDLGLGEEWLSRQPAHARSFISGSGFETQVRRAFINANQDEDTKLLGQLGQAKREHDAALAQAVDLGVFARAEGRKKVDDAIGNLDFAAAMSDGAIQRIPQALRDQMANPREHRIHESRILQDIMELGYDPETAAAAVKAYAEHQSGEHYYDQEEGGVILAKPGDRYGEKVKTVEEAIFKAHEDMDTVLEQRARESRGNLNFRAPSGHRYPDPNPIGHLRTNRRNVGGVTTRFVDEMQADLHKAASEDDAPGYRTPEIMTQDEALRTQIDRTRASIMDQANGLRDLLVQAYPPSELSDDSQLLTDLDDPGDARSFIEYGMEPHVNGLVNAGTLPPDAAKQLMDAAAIVKTDFEQLEKAEADRRALGALALLPDIPYKGNEWVTLLLRRAVAMAIDQGEPAVGLTTGIQQAKRWSSALENIRSFGRSAREGTVKVHFNGTTLDDEQLHEVDRLLRAEGRTTETDRFAAWREGQDPDNPQEIKEIEDEEEVEVDRSEAPWSMNEVEHDEALYQIQDSDGNDVGGETYSSEREAQRALDRMDPPYYTYEVERWKILDEFGDEVEDVEDADDDDHFFNESDADDYVAKPWFMLVDANGDHIEDSEYYNTEQKAQLAANDIPGAQVKPTEFTTEQGESKWKVADKDGDDYDETLYDDQDEAQQAIYDNDLEYRLAEVERDPEWEVYNHESGDNEYFDNRRDAQNALEERIDEWVEEQGGRTKNKKRTVGPDDFVLERPLSVGSKGYADVYDLHAIKDLTNWLKPYGVKPEKKPIQAYEITDGGQDPQGRTPEQIDEELKQLQFEHDARNDEAGAAWELYEKFRASMPEPRNANLMGPIGGDEELAQGELFDPVQHAIKLEEDYYKKLHVAKMLGGAIEDLKQFRGNMGNYEVRQQGKPLSMASEGSFRTREEAEKFKADKENEINNLIWWAPLPPKFVEDVRKYGLPLMTIPLALGAGGGGDDDDKKRKDRSR